MRLLTAFSLSLALLVLLATSSAMAEPQVITEDRLRIQEHLAEVEEELRQRDVSHLSEELQQARVMHLDNLRDYRLAGEFPHNTHVPWRHPVFIDREDRACAVGHLMIVSGWEEEARRLSERENLAYLLEMESPEVAQWVEVSGLTAEEAAWIQPGYSPCNYCQCDGKPVCGSDGNTYQNSCVAQECAGVEIAHAGCCDLGDEVSHDISDGFYHCQYNGPDVECSAHPEEPMPEPGDDTGGSNDDVGTADVGTADVGTADVGTADVGTADDVGFASEDSPGEDSDSACASVGSGSVPTVTLLLMLLLVGVYRSRHRQPQTA